MRHAQDLTAQEEELVARARHARDSAYAPYSGFPVGAALQVADGRVYLGANVENASYPATICAERVALPAAVVAGHRDLALLAVAGSGPAVVTPCGICRQVLFEFAPDLAILATGDGPDVTRFVLDRDLLPHGFGPSSLPPPPA